MYEREEKVTNKKLEKKIEELDLSVRSYNSLKRAGIHTIGELTQKTEEEMMRIRNMGRKSLKEVIQNSTSLALTSAARMIRITTPAMTWMKFPKSPNCLKTRKINKTTFLRRIYICQEVIEN